MEQLEQHPKESEYQNGELLPMLSEEARRRSLNSLPQTWYETRIADLKKDYADKKAALDRQRTDTEFDSMIIKTILLQESTDEIFRVIQTNDQHGESLYFWIKQIGRPSVHFTLCEIIARYKEAFKEEKYMSDNEISHIANFFIDTMPYSFRFSELIYFMNKGCAGAWGKMFGQQMTAPVFFEWFEKYMNELSGKLEGDHVTRKDITRPAPERIEDLIKGKFNKWSGESKQRPRVVPDEKWFNKNSEGR